MKSRNTSLHRQQQIVQPIYETLGITEKNETIHLVVDDVNEIFSFKIEVETKDKLLKYLDDELLILFIVTKRLEAPVTSYYQQATTAHWIALTNATSCPVYQYRLQRTLIYKEEREQDKLQKQMRYTDVPMPARSTWSRAADKAATDAPRTAPRDNRQTRTATKSSRRYGANDANIFTPSTTPNNAPTVTVKVNAPPTTTPKNTLSSKNHPYP